MAKAYYHNLPTVLCKVLGVYTIGSHNKETGKKVPKTIFILDICNLLLCLILIQTMDNVVVMENIFFEVSFKIKRSD